jgi:stage II sporulation protein D
MKLFKYLIYLWIIHSLNMHALVGQSLSIWIDPQPGMKAFTYLPQQQQMWIMTTDSFPELIASATKGDVIKVGMLAGKVQLTVNTAVIGQFPELYFWTADSAGKFRLQPEGTKKSIEYYDHLKVQVHKQQIRLIHDVWIEHYIPGVVAAEGGIYKTPEFLKVQAICSRTYAIRNLGKYQRDGFDLSDKVDCQVYHGIPVNMPALEAAVYETRGMIALDEFDEPIDAVFSANCGGQSANSEDVWSATTPYLKSTESYDQYREFKNSSWTYSVARPELLKIFSEYYKTPVYTFSIEPDYSGRVRQVRLNDDTKSVISGTELRRLLKLKSTKFRVYEHQGFYFFSGQGFGHGVGMCQDGAYKLSTLGWSYESILRHFYTGVRIVDLAEYLEMPLIGDDAESLTQELED